MSAMNNVRDAPAWGASGKSVMVAWPVKFISLPAAAQIADVVAAAATVALAVLIAPV
jgi:hypothetical protein